MKCVRCNKEIDKGDLFCGYCGINQAKYAKYLEKITKKVHKEQDKEYNKRVKEAQKNLDTLNNSRDAEINRIEDSRWETIGNNTGFYFNMIEGKVMINDADYKFSDIKGAEIIKQESSRTVVNTTQTGKTKSKKHASIGGGLLGAAVGGPLGAAVGGSVLGKTTTKGKTNVVSNSDTIPTCYHIGVDVDLNGFNTEIVLLSRTVDQTSGIYNSTFQTAQSIVNKLRKLSKTPVPKKFLKPEEEESVLKIDKEIKEAEKELKETIADKPTYEIPEEYLK